MAKKYIELEAVNRLLDRFIGYLDEDMIYRIKQKIKCIPSIDVQKIGYSKQKPRHIIDKPKSGARIFTTRVTPNGIIIDNILYGIRYLIDEHCNEKVKIRIVNDIATVFDIETGEQIVWFELYLHNGVNCKHSFYPLKD